MKTSMQLTIGAHKFKISVADDQREQFIAAAGKVSRMFEQTRVAYKVADGERAALMVALRLAAGDEEGDQAVDQDALDRIEAVLDDALAGTDV